MKRLVLIFVIVPFFSMAQPLDPNYGADHPQTEAVSYVKRILDEFIQKQKERIKAILARRKKK